MHILISARLGHIPKPRPKMAWLNFLGDAQNSSDCSAIGNTIAWVGMYRPQIKHTPNAGPSVEGERGRERRKKERERRCTYVLMALKVVCGGVDPQTHPSAIRNPQSP